MTESAPTGPSPAGPDPAPRCPVCSARLRAVRVCGRCGVDLTELMRLVVAGWRARRDGWAALGRGDLRAARAAVRRSSSLAASRSAQRLSWLARAIDGRAAPDRGGSGDPDRPPA